MTKYFIMVAVLCLAIPSAVRAQQSSADAPATKDDVERYLNIIHAHQTMVDMAQAMLKPMHEMIHEEFLKNKEKCSLPPDFEAHENKMIDDMMNSMPWDQIIEVQASVYQKYLTKGDVDALITFYSSPTGQKMFKEMPQMMADSMKAMMPLITEQTKAMQDRVKQQVAEIEKESSQQTSCDTQPRS